MNVTFGLIEDTSHSPVRDKQVRRQQMVDRALAAIGRVEGTDLGAARPSYRPRAGRMPTWEDIEAARRRLAGVAHRTPVLHSRQFDAECGAEVYFKAENLQRGGAFKFRGAYNKIKAESERGTVEAVVAFSSGNHAQAVALVSKLLGIRATIVMPNDAPPVEARRRRAVTAPRSSLYDREAQSRDDLAAQIARERNALLVPPFDDELIMAGQATGAVELLEDVPDLDTLVVPVSGGGLIGGWATAARHLRPADPDLRRRAGDRRRREALASGRIAGRGHAEPRRSPTACA